MTFAEFKTLKVGGIVHVPSNDRKTFTCTEIDGIDNLFKKIKPFPSNRYYSYRYLQKDVPFEKIRTLMGRAKSVSK